MYGRDRWQLSNSPEQSPDSGFLKYALGGAALALMAGVVASKSPAVQSTVREIISHVDKDARETRPYTVELLTATALSFNVPLEQSHIDYWRTMEAVYLAVDRVIDESQPESIDREALSLICGQPIGGISKEQAQNFSVIIHTASEERKNIILSGLEAQDIAEKLRGTSDVREMLALREQESLLLTQIMTLDNPHHDTRIDRFNEYMLSAGVSAYQTDTLRDLSADYKSGVSAVRPTPRNYLIAAKEATATTSYTMRQLPSSALPSLAFIGIKRAISHVLSKA